MSYSFSQFFSELSVTLIDIEIIAFKEIIAYINVGQEISIYISNSNAQTKTDKTAIDTGIFTDICKKSAIIAHQFIATTFEFFCHIPVFGAQFPLVGIIECIDGNETVVEDVTVEIPILVIIKKGSMCSESGIIQAIPCCLIGKMHFSIINPEFVLRIHTGLIACIANIDIQVTILINIYQGYARTPLLFIPETCRLRYIFKRPIAFIKIKFIGSHVGCKEHIR